jgi:hypothetical protein
LKVLATIVLLSLVSFAGCVGSEAGVDPGVKSTEAAAPAEFDDSTGGVQGIVVDDESRPISGATIGILKSAAIESDLVATSDSVGAFSISRIPPGDHMLNAQALGYDAAAKRITIVAGEVVELTLVLTPLPVDGPHKLTYIVKGNMDWGVAYKLTPTCIYEPLTTIDPRAKTCGGVRSGGGSNGEIGLGAVKKPDGAGDLTPDWQTILIELTWAQQTPVFGRSLQLDVIFPNITRGASGSVNNQDPRFFGGEDYSSPVVMRIDRPQLDVRKILPDDQYGDVRARVFTAWSDLGTYQVGPDVGIMAEQSWTYYVTLAYGEPLPEKFSGLPDA